MTDARPRTVVEMSDALGVEISVQFAPVRRLDDGVLAGAELQLRGPTGTALGSADSLSRAARMMAQNTTLDRSKYAFARTDAARVLADAIPLLVEIDIGSRELDTDLVDASPAADDGALRLVVSVRASDLFEHPHRILAKIEQARARGIAISLDGLGAEDNAAALLALIEPDIVRTSSDFLTRTTDLTMAQLAHGLAAHLERSNAVVIAAGVDTVALAQAARTLGATYGVGALYPAKDDPTSLVGEPVTDLPKPPRRAEPTPRMRTPYQIAEAVHGEPKRGTKRLLIQMTRALEAQASAMGPTMIVLGTFQDARYYNDTTAQRWRNLADTVGYAGVYGLGLVHMLDGNVHHAPLLPDDELATEWTVAVLSPHHAALLTARDVHHGHDELERTFDFFQTFDRDTVTRSVHAVLHRFTEPV